MNLPGPIWNVMFEILKTLTTTSQLMHSSNKYLCKKMQNSAWWTINNKKFFDEIYFGFRQKMWTIKSNDMFFEFICSFVKVLTSNILGADAILNFPHFRWLLWVNQESCLYIFKAARRSAALLGFAVLLLLLLLLLLFCLSFPQKRKEMTIYPRVPCAAAWAVA